MQTLKKQTDAKIAMGRKNNPKFMQGVDDIIEKAKADVIDEKAIQVGQKVPSFELPDALGNMVSLTDLLKNGPLVITFYRGSWCPYCNLQLRALQDKLNDIKMLGASLVAISPEVPDSSMTDNEISTMEFTVLSDQDANVALKYGVAWEVPEFLLDHMRNDRNLDLKSINNGNSSVLPIPATFIVGIDGKVIWSYVNIDYRTRSEPDEIVAVLKNVSQ